ncbi:hypothetical protein LCGC14_2371070 [marine sediment metagenome]|uniref:Uncharacterized protein n=1 Tax=marine sediment metagenome TaxID=412755 RepID=A0A0F9CQZ7_9ZZZZ
MSKLICATLSCHRNTEGFCTDPNVLACYNRIRPGLLYAQIEEAASSFENRLEQVANLLTSWKTQIPKFAEDPYLETRLVARRLELCINELESVLAGRSCT